MKNQRYSRQGYGENEYRSAGKQRGNSRYNKNTGDYRNSENDRYSKQGYRQGKQSDGYNDRDFRGGDHRDNYSKKNTRDQRPSKYNDEYKKPRYEEQPRFDAPMHAEDELPYIIMGRNAVREAVKSGRSIDRILVVPERDGSLREIVNLARDNNIIIQETAREKLDELCMPFGHGGKPGNHQGIVARVPGAEYVEIDDILNIARERGEQPFILLLDGITDPYNLGSVIRSAECAGVHGIVIPKRRSASLTASVVKVSAGAVEHMAVARVTNISTAIERLKREGLWVAGADMSGEPMHSAKLEGALALVIGAEGAGLSKLVSEKCDFLVSIPMHGKLDSLNASVAAAVIMFEKNRQDANAKK